MIEKTQDPGTSNTSKRWEWPWVLSAINGLRTI